MLNFLCFLLPAVSSMILTVHAADLVDPPSPTDSVGFLAPTPFFIVQFDQSDYNNWKLISLGGQELVAIPAGPTKEMLRTLLEKDETDYQNDEDGFQKIGDHFNIGCLVEDLVRAPGLDVEVIRERDLEIMLPNGERVEKMALRRGGRSRYSLD